MKWKKKKKIKWLLSVFMLLCLIQTKTVSASDGEGYIIISVDAKDDNGNLKYAIDTDDPSAFTDSNEFRIPEGTSHTIYVKDVAGNITSRAYEPAGSSDTNTTATTPQATVTTGTGDGSEGKINIEVEIGDKQNSIADTTEPKSNYDYSNYEYLTDDPVEPGGATAVEKIKTDGSDTAEKIFYTFQTKEGETLYLVIDQAQSSDNVYLLDTVSINDLMVLADGKAPRQEEEDNLLSALSKEQTAGDEVEDIPKKESGNSNLFIIIFALAAFAGIYYYIKIYKPKKEASMDELDDAMDMDEFEAESEEEEEIDFDDAEKEAFLDTLINGDETDTGEETDESMFYDANPDEYAEYATPHIKMEESIEEKTINSNTAEILEPEKEESGLDEESFFSDTDFGEDGEEM